MTIGIIAQEVQKIMPNFVISESTPERIFSFEKKDNEESNITFHAQNSEMLKITADGFYVRGVKVPADEKEAESVYRAFKQFLIWSALTRN